MLRIGNIKRSVDFYTKILGMKVLRTFDQPQDKYTLIFLGYEAEEKSCVIELTYNYGVENYNHGDAFGHIAIAVNDCYAACEQITNQGGKVTRSAGSLKGSSEIIAFIKDPDGYVIELIQKRHVTNKIT